MPRPVSALQMYELACEDWGFPLSIVSFSSVQLSNQ